VCYCGVLRLDSVDLNDIFLISDRQSREVERWSRGTRVCVRTRSLSLVSPLFHSFYRFLSPSLYMIKHRANVIGNPNKEARLSLNTFALSTPIFLPTDRLPHRNTAPIPLVQLFFLIWCCLYYFVRNSLVALLEALCARIFSFRFVYIGFCFWNIYIYIYILCVCVCKVSNKAFLPPLSTRLLCLVVSIPLVCWLYMFACVCVPLYVHVKMYR